MGRRSVRDGECEAEAGWLCTSQARIHSPAGFSGGAAFRIARLRISAIPPNSSNNHARSHYNPPLLNRSIRCVLYSRS